jgi:5'-nucleotidase
VRGDPQVPPDASVQRIVDDYPRGSRRVRPVVVGTLLHALGNTPNAAGESLAGSLIADAQLRATQPSALGRAQIALQNPGGVRGNGFSFGGAVSVRRHLRRCLLGAAVRQQPGHADADDAAGARTCWSSSSRAAAASRTAHPAGLERAALCVERVCAALREGGRRELDADRPRRRAAAHDRRAGRAGRPRRRAGPGPALARDGQQLPRERRRRFLGPGRRRRRAGRPAGHRRPGRLPGGFKAPAAPYDTTDPALGLPRITRLP